MLEEYIETRKKKLNQKMILLTDCIGMEEPMKPEILDLTNSLGDIFELRGIAIKNLTTQITNNNVYNYWHMQKKGQEDKNLDNINMKVQFYDMIDQRCEELFEKYKLKVNPFFDQNQYNENITFIEIYYKLDPQLEFMTKRVNQ